MYCSFWDGVAKLNPEPAQPIPTPALRQLMEEALWLVPEELMWQKRPGVQACLVLLCFALLRFTDNCVFYKLKVCGNPA